MIELHHLNASRSRRIIWLLEELEVPYAVVAHHRDATTNLAPPELADIHPLGKSPVVRDNGRTFFESGAIIEYLVRRHGKGRFQPEMGTLLYDRYIQFLHYAEGSAMLPLMLRLYVSRLKDAGKPLHPRIDGELANHMGFLDGELNGQKWFIGDALSGADFQLSFVAQLAVRFVGRESYPNLTAFADRIEMRPAYVRAVEKHGT